MIRLARPACLLLVSLALGCAPSHAQLGRNAFGRGDYGQAIRELSETAWTLPPSCAANRYSVVVHGVGLCDEYPAVRYDRDFERSGYDGLFHTGMTVCVESYIGEEGGHEGVKLEQQVLITETGSELLSDFPFEERLLSREI